MLVSKICTGWLTARKSRWLRPHHAPGQLPVQAHEEACPDPPQWTVNRLASSKNSLNPVRVPEVPRRVEAAEALPDLPDRAIDQTVAVVGVEQGSRVRVDQELVPGNPRRVAFPQRHPPVLLRLVVAAPQLHAGLVAGQEVGVR